MLAILSPAKSLDETPVSAGIRRSGIAFESDTRQLLKTLKRLRPADLKALMGVSDKLADLNHTRHQAIELPLPAESIPAALLFAADVYRGLDARSLDAESLEWASEHVAILSGLYGLLRPLDAVAPYRLEMGTKLKTRRGANLYAFWGTRLAKRIDTQLAGHADRVVVDLASKEYASAVPRKAVKADWLTVQFKEIRDGKPRIISFFAKYARGLMARYLVEHRIEHREAIKGFDREGYAFSPDLSSESTFVFTRASK